MTKFTRTPDLYMETIRPSATGPVWAVKRWADHTVAFEGSYADCEQYVKENETFVEHWNRPYQENWWVKESERTA